MVLFYIFKRVADGAMISSEDIARKLELRRRLIFSLPRLIRNTEGRPLGVSTICFT